MIWMCTLNHPFQVVLRHDQDAKVHMRETEIVCRELAMRVLHDDGLYVQAILLISFLPTSRRERMVKHAY